MHKVLRELSSTLMHLNLTLSILMILLHCCCKHSCEEQRISKCNILDKSITIGRVINFKLWIFPRINGNSLLSTLQCNHEYGKTYATLDRIVNVVRIKKVKSFPSHKAYRAYRVFYTTLREGDGGGLMPPTFDDDKLHFNFLLLPKQQVIYSLQVSALSVNLRPNTIFVNTYGLTV